MDEDFFLRICTENGYDQKAREKFQAAFQLAKETLKDKKRLAGDTFFDHNLRVGLILVENQTTPEAVIAGLLHGLLHYLPEEELRRRFGEEIVSLIKRIEEIKKVKQKNPRLEAEALRKIILTTIQDIRVTFVKLANKLDNLRSLEALPSEEQQRIAGEVLEVYAPLAYRLGMLKIKNQLEDLSFRTLHPRQYQEIVRFLQESSEAREQDIAEAIELVKKMAANQVVLIKIKGRPKHIYSIYRKMTEKGIKLHQQFDLLGIRAIVPEVKDCYILLGLLHQNFEPVEGRLKDYIANPKPNFYRSLHTAVRLPNKKIAEIQIRTPEMEELAEEGLAAHWRYKGVRSAEMFEKKISWLKGILDLQKELGSQEFLETAKVDLFGDEIYCYTPKGDVKELPKGATILDFAYAVHEEVGNQAVAGRVNGRFVSLKEELNQGDIVEIITHKLQRPRRDWIKYVKSSQARQKIRKSLRGYEKLPSLHYRPLKQLVKEELGLFVESPDFPQALCLLAKCCLPLPDQPLAGLATKRRIISVHRQDCRAFLKEEKRGIKVQWKKTFNQKIRFFVLAEERSGLLADLLHTIAAAGFEIQEAKAKLINRTHAQCSFLVIPKDLEHLKELIRKVGKVKGIVKVYLE